MIIAGIFLCKLCAVLASSGSGAPGGVLYTMLLLVLPLACCMVVAWDYGSLMAKKLRFYLD
ncbi:hypothetical protein ACLB1M_13300 [Escherichia coli]